MEGYTYERCFIHLQISCLLSKCTKHGGVHIIKQMCIWTKFKEQTKVMEATKFDWDIVKDITPKEKTENKAKKDDNINLAVTVAKAVFNKDQKAWDKGKTMAEVVGAQTF